VLPCATRRTSTSFVQRHLQIGDDRRGGFLAGRGHVVLFPAALPDRERRRLPYLFVIVSGTEAEEIGKTVPDHLLTLVSAVMASSKAKGKRSVEERVVDFLAEAKHPVIEKTHARVLSARWYVLSARRAHRLLRDKLFDRVYAVRIRNFNRAYSGAEIDMHFSISSDLTPLDGFLEKLRSGGVQLVATLSSNGEI
jgi:hypothetical protein